MPKDDYEEGGKALEQRIQPLLRQPLQMDPNAVPFQAQGPGGIAAKLQPKMQEHRKVLMKNDPNALAAHAYQHGLTNEDVKYLIDDNFSSPKIRMDTFQKFLAASSRLRENRLTGKEM